MSRHNLQVSKEFQVTVCATWYVQNKPEDRYLGKGGSGGRGKWHLARLPDSHFSSWCLTYYLHWYGRFQLLHTVLRHEVCVSIGVKYRIGHPAGILILRGYSQYGLIGLGIRVWETIEECRW
jgi:hypothetical protein